MMAADLPVDLPRNSGSWSKQAEDSSPRVSQVDFTKSLVCSKESNRSSTSVSGRDGFTTSPQTRWQPCPIPPERNTTTPSDDTAKWWISGKRNGRYCRHITDQ